MSEWITDRLPTEEDVDINDCVYNELGVYTHWQDIEEGRAWMPIIPPQPYGGVAMSESKHTPGPWSIGNLASYDGYTGQPYRNVWARQGEAATVIARAIRRHGETNDVDANAALIAAAPELLEALEEIMKQTDQRSNYLIDHVYLIAAAAIAKAKGEEL